MYGMKTRVIGVVCISLTMSLGAIADIPTCFFAEINEETHADLEHSMTVRVGDYQVPFPKVFSEIEHRSEKGNTQLFFRQSDVFDFPDDGDLSSKDRGVWNNLDAILISSGQDFELDPKLFSVTGECTALGLNVLSVGLSREDGGLEETRIRVIQISDSTALVLFGREFERYWALLKAANPEAQSEG